MDLESIAAKNEKAVRREDERILSKAILGHSLSELYSNDRIKLAVTRNEVKNMISQFNSTDVAEIFSPERVTSACKAYLDQPWTSRMGTTSTLRRTEHDAGRPLSKRSQN